MLKWSYSDEYAYYLSICHMDGVALTTKVVKSAIKRILGHSEFGIPEVKQRKSTTGPSLADELLIVKLDQYESMRQCYEHFLRIITGVTGRDDKTVKPTPFKFTPFKIHPI
ncbi:hypothetical protein YC2023_014106 [Brassica napus]